MPKQLKRMLEEKKRNVVSSLEDGEEKKSEEGRKGARELVIRVGGQGEAGQASMGKRRSPKQGQAEGKGGEM